MEGEEGGNEGEKERERRLVLPTASSYHLIVSSPRHSGDGVVQIHHGAFALPTSTLLPYPLPAHGHTQHTHTVITR